VRLYSRNAYDWTARLESIAAAAKVIKAKSFTIDGEAVVLGADGLSRFEELRRREAARTAILYAFDLIEHDGEDLRGLPFLNRKAALARLLRNTKAAILLASRNVTLSSPAAADVSTVDTLPAEPEHGPAWGEGRCRLSGRAAGGKYAGAEMGQQRLSDLAVAPIGISAACRAPLLGIEGWLFR
jgi:hypothetical protein